MPTKISEGSVARVPQTDLSRTELQEVAQNWANKLDVNSKILLCCQAIAGIDFVHPAFNQCWYERIKKCGDNFAGLLVSDFADLGVKGSRCNTSHVYLSVGLSADASQVVITRIDAWTKGPHPTWSDRDCSVLFRFDPTCFPAECCLSHPYTGNLFFWIAFAHKASLIPFGSEGQTTGGLRASGSHLEWARFTARLLAKADSCGGESRQP